MPRDSNVRIRHQLYIYACMLEMNSEDRCRQYHSAASQDSYSCRLMMSSSERFANDIAAAKDLKDSRAAATNLSSGRKRTFSRLIEAIKHQRFVKLVLDFCVGNRDGRVLLHTMVMATPSECAQAHTYECRKKQLGVAKLLPYPYSRIVCLAVGYLEGLMGTLAALHRVGRWHNSSWEMRDSLHLLAGMMPRAQSCVPASVLTFGLASVICWVYLQAS